MDKHSALRRSLLIVDDEPQAIEMLARLLEQHGEYRVLRAGDGQEAIALLEKELPPVALVDVQMPGISGLDVMRTVHERNIPTELILMSGFENTEAFLQAIEGGVHRFLKKPIHKEALREAVESAFLSHQAREEQQRYRFFSEVTSEGILVMSDKSVVDVSPSFERILGWGRQQLLEGDFGFFLEEHSRELLSERISKEIYGSWSAMALHREKGLRHFHVDCHAAIQLNRKVRVMAFKDVTESVILQTRFEEVKNREKLLESVVEQGGDHVLITDRQGKILYVNRAFELITGYGKEEILGKDPSLLNSGKNPKNIFKTMWQALEQGRSFSTTLINRRKDGSLFDDQKTLFPLKNEGGEISYFVSVGRDVTKEREQDRMIRRLGRIMEEAPEEIILLKEEDLRIIDANRGARENLGYAKEEIIGLGIEEYSVDVSSEQVRGILKKLKKSGDAISLENYRRRKDGSTYPVLLKIQYLKDETPPLLLVTGRDMTESEQNRLALEESNRKLRLLNHQLENRVAQEVNRRREQEQRLNEQSRIASMTELLHWISHHWRQPLNVIALAMQDVAEAQQTGELNETYMQEAESTVMKTVDKMSRTIDEFRNFFVASEEKVVFDMARIVREVLHLYSYGLASERIELSMYCGILDRTFTMEELIDGVEEGGEPCLQVIGYPTEFKRALGSLLANAREAILEARQERVISQEQSRIELSSRKVGKFGEITIFNYGKPIEEGVLPKIFDPYFTTKEQGEGVGMGLFMSRTLIEKEMSGHLLVENREDGVAFKVQMPLATP